MEKDRVLNTIRDEKVIAIVRLKDPSLLIEAGETLIRGGIKVIEFSLNTKGAIHAIERFRSLYDSIIVGAGTVLTREDAERTIGMGAHFLVSPCFQKEVRDLAVEKGVTFIPGALTPAEIFYAFREGGDMIKVFPAEPLGPSYIRSILNPFPSIPLVPTGGVGEGNAKDYLKAGAVAVACGGRLVDESALKEGKNDELYARIRRFLDMIRKEG